MAGEMQDAARGMGVTLLPCPLCGGAARLFDRMNASVVTCTACECSVRQSELGIGDAPERWNTRAHPPAAEREAPGEVVVPEGWKSAPIIPSTKMRKAGSKVFGAVTGHPSIDLADEVWRLMLAAAPPPPAPIGADGTGEREKALRAMFDAGVAQGFEAGDNPSHNYATVKSDDEAFLAAIAALATPAEGQGNG